MSVPCIDVSRHGQAGQSALRFPAAAQPCARIPGPALPLCRITIKPSRPARCCSMALWRATTAEGRQPTTCCSCVGKVGRCRRQQPGRLRCHNATA